MPAPAVTVVDAVTLGWWRLLTRVARGISGRGGAESRVGKRGDNRAGREGSRAAKRGESGRRTSEQGAGGAATDRNVARRIFGELCDRNSLRDQPTDP